MPWHDQAEGRGRGMDTRRKVPGRDVRSKQRDASPRVEALEGRALMAAGGSITDIATLPAGLSAGPITVGADANLWFAEVGNSGGPALGKVSGMGTRAEIPLPAGDAGYSITSVAADAAGNVWYALNSSSSSAAGGPAGKVGKVAPGGAITEYALPNPSETPGAMTIGLDGLPYVSVSGGNAPAIDRVNADGSMTEFPVSGAKGAVTWLTLGPGGNLWFVDGQKIGKMTMTGTVTEYPISPPPGSTATVDLSNAQLTVGRDGNIWFLGLGGISKITPTGTVTTIGSAGSTVTSLSAGPDGNLWVALNPPAGSQLAEVPGEVVIRLTPDGQITPLSDHVDTGNNVVRMAYSPGSLWLDEGGTTLSRVNVSSVPSITPAQITPTTPRAVSTNAKKLLAGPLVSFTANYPGALATDFTASVNYGDGYTANGAVVPDVAGGFDVLGYELYTLPVGTSVKATVDVTGPGGIVTEVYGVVTIAGPVTKAKAPAKVAHPKGPVAQAVKVKKT